MFIHAGKARAPADSSSQQSHAIHMPEVVPKLTQNSMSFAGFNNQDKPQASMQAKATVASQSNVVAVPALT